MITENPQKVLIISSLYMPHLGGVEKYSQNLAYALSKTFEVHIFCMNTENQPAFRMDRAVAVHSLPCHALFNGRLPLPGSGAAERLRQFLDENNISFAIIQTRLYPFNLEAAEILKKRAVPFLLIEHGTGHVRFKSFLMDGCWQLYEHGITVRWKQICKDYYGVSQAGANWLSHFGIKAKGVIPNGINPSEFNAIEPNWRAGVGIPDDAILLTFAGRVLKTKGILDLLRACAQLDNPRLHLVIAGDGEMELLETWRGDPRVHILGKVMHSELLMILKDTQIFCLPTAYPEGLPTVILEAGALGVPVVATDRGGIAEVVKDGTTGLIVPAGDPDSLAKALQSLVDSAELCRDYGSALRDLIYAHYTWETAGALVTEKILSHSIKQEHSEEI